MEQIKDIAAQSLNDIASHQDTIVSEYIDEITTVVKVLSDKNHLHLGLSKTSFIGKSLTYKVYGKADDIVSFKKDLAKYISHLGKDEDEHSCRVS